MPRKARGQRISAAPGGTYGSEAAQENAQRVAPLAKGQEVPTHTNLPEAGTLGWDAPGDGRPITHGAPIGEGPGPEALAPIAQGNAGVTDTLAPLAMGPHSTPEIRSLLQAAQTMGL